MKKLFVLALVFVLLISGCEKEPEKIVPEVPEISEVPEAEVSESLPEEEPVEEVPEEPETTDEWEKFLREMNENGISENDIGVLENAGFEQEELKTMSTTEMHRQIAIIKHGISEEKIAYAKKLIENSEEAKSKENPLNLPEFQTILLRQLSFTLFMITKISIISQITKEFPFHL